MTNETTKQFFRRTTDRRYVGRWIVGRGIDIGSGDDPLSGLGLHFPLMQSVREFDLPDGDAMTMDGVPAGAYDFVHSSHCLEHLVDPAVALGNWIRICRPGGHILVTVPDEDLYEQGIWPSSFNPDHKWSFTIAKPSSWSPKSINLLELLSRFTREVEILKIELLDAGFIYDQHRYDQTMGPLAESAIEFVLRKRPVENPSAMAQEPATETETGLFERAVSLHQQDRLAEAMALYRRILATHADNIPSMSNLALLVGRDEALSLLGNALTLMPDHYESNVNMGRMMLDAGDLSTAEARFKRACRVQPADTRAWLGLVLTYRALGRDDDAANALNVASAPGQDRIPERLSVDWPWITAGIADPYP